MSHRAGTAVELDASHRHHAVVGLAIRDLKHGAYATAPPAGLGQRRLEGPGHPRPQPAALDSGPQPAHPGLTGAITLPAASCPSRAGSPQTPAETSSTYPAAGPGSSNPPPRSPGSALPRSPDRPLAPVPPIATTPPAPATASNEAGLTLPPPHRSGGLRSADSHASKDQSRHGSNDHAANQEGWIQV